VHHPGGGGRALVGVARRVRRRHGEGVADVTPAAVACRPVVGRYAAVVQLAREGAVGLAAAEGEADAGAVGRAARRGAAVDRRLQIGRASCRGGVWIAVVGVARRVRGRHGEGRGGRAPVAGGGRAG